MVLDMEKGYAFQVSLVSYSIYNAQARGLETLVTL